MEAGTSRLSDDSPLAQELYCLVAALPISGRPELALARLAAALEAAYGTAGETLGEAVRTLPDILPFLVEMAGSEQPGTLDALYVLANCVSDAVDARSAETKRALLSTPGAAETLFDVVTDDDGLLDNRVAAAACLQNLLSDPAWVFVLAQEQDLLDDLELLVGDENFCADAQLAHYLLGALANAAQAAATTAGCELTLRESTWRMVRSRREEHLEEQLLEEDALDTIANAIAKKKGGGAPDSPTSPTSRRKSSAGPINPYTGAPAAAPASAPAAARAPSAKSRSVLFDTTGSAASIDSVSSDDLEKGDDGAGIGGGGGAKPPKTLSALLEPTMPAAEKVARANGKQPQRPHSADIEAPPLPAAEAGWHRGQEEEQPQTWGQKKAESFAEYMKKKAESGGSSEEVIAMAPSGVSTMLPRIAAAIQGASSASRPGSQAAQAPAASRLKGLLRGAAFQAGVGTDGDLERGAILSKWSRAIERPASLAEPPPPVLSPAPTTQPKVTPRVDSLSKPKQPMSPPHTNGGPNSPSPRASKLLKKGEGTSSKKGLLGPGSFTSSFNLMKAKPSPPKAGASSGSTTGGS